MKIKAIMAAAALLLTAACSSGTPERRAQEVLRRTFGHVPANVEFRYTGPADSTDAYSLEVRQGRLRVSGTSVVAMCKGFHDYIQEQGYGCVMWSGSRLDMPAQLESMHGFRFSPLKGGEMKMRNNKYILNNSKL